MIGYHWENANSYLQYSLRSIRKEYDLSSEKPIINIEEFEQREKERSQFIKFHYTLGALLTYKSKYKSIKQMFNYTMSEPPSYELLPSSMDEIFSFYYETINYDYNPYRFRFYSFPDQSGINAESVIIKWTCEYIGILFLRQYTIRQYINPLAFPVLPSTQSELKYWIDYLSNFKRIIQAHLDNVDLNESLGFSFITRKWCEDNNKIYPIDFLENLEAKLKEKYEDNKINLPISIEKVNEFNKKTQTILEHNIDKFMLISNLKKLNVKEKYYCRGKSIFYSKDAFAKSPEVHHLDFESFLANIIVKDLSKSVIFNFYTKRTKTYLLKSIELFKGIDKLDLNQEHIIINVGLNINAYINSPHLQIRGLSQNSYKKVDIYSFPNFRGLHSTLFIIKKSDLPTISILDLTKDEIEKYSLQAISEKYQLYSSILDLNLVDDKLLTELKTDKDEIKTKVLMTLDFLLEIRWKKRIKLLEIKEFSEYLDQGLPNELKEIKPIN